MPVASCLSSSRVRDLLPVTGLLRCSASCACATGLQACRSATYCQHRPLCVACHWSNPVDFFLSPATCYPSALVVCHLLPACACGLPPVTRMPQLPSAYRQSVPEDFHLSPAHVGGLLPDAGACWWPVTCHQCAPVNCCLSSAHAGGLSPVAGMCWYPSTCCRHMGCPTTVTHVHQ